MQMQPYGMFVCHPGPLLQALFGPSASQHTFELQDCAQHLHQHIISLRHQYSPPPEGHQAGGSSPPVTEQGSTPAVATAVIDPKLGSKSEAAGSTGNAAAARKAQAKARQAAMMARMKQQQALFTDTGSEGDAVNATKVIWTKNLLSLMIHVVSAQLHFVLSLAYFILHVLLSNVSHQCKRARWHRKHMAIALVYITG